ncbi:frataxin family protein [Pelosinus propionicus]|uniref:Uncharacterized protein n=1 Tax=Pelosinus propionicus DSM 13327 TaxID=1123291 RepID=A0A1I4P247_9FIRM|nr:hypothetical protein [Pelosinus propionicus]SFM21828.1 hypothetical protein SAMN04490355_105627 [Pelosinus propionicus DSM 13327]
MNQYLSRDEKENLVRLMTLRVQLEKVIELYSSLKNVDKKFLSELRHARTRLEKSADIRLGYLDEQAKENLMVSISKPATPEAIQANVEDDLDLDCENNGLPVTLLLNSGLKIVMHLPEHMTECLIEEIKRPSRFSRSICAKFVDDEFVAIDMQEVVGMHVSGLEDLEWAKLKPVQTQSNSTTDQERYRIECSCGAEYFANMYNGFPGGRTKGRCRECQKTVFADLQVKEISDPSDGVGATLLTNRYFVNREPQQVKEMCQEQAPSRNLQVHSKNYGREYKDPCQLIG